MDQVTKLALAALIAAPADVAAAGQVVPLYDPVALNIGLNCRWQPRCMKDQEKAMRRSLSFIRKQQPALWRVHLCNHNAARGHSRIDWIGFYNCIRNTSLQPLPPPRPFARRTRR